MTRWDLGNGTIMLQKSDLKKNFAKDAKILRLSQKSWKTNSAKLQKNLPTSFCACWCHESNEKIPDCVQNVWKFVTQDVC